MNLWLFAQIHDTLAPSPCAPSICLRPQCTAPPCGVEQRIDVPQLLPLPWRRPSLGNNIRDSLDNPRVTSIPFFSGGVSLFHRLVLFATIGTGIPCALSSDQSGLKDRQGSCARDLDPDEVSNYRDGRSRWKGCVSPFIESEDPERGGCKPDLDWHDRSDLCEEVVRPVSRRTLNELRVSSPLKITPITGGSLGSANSQA